MLISILGRSLSYALAMVSFAIRLDNGEIKGSRTEIRRGTGMFEFSTLGAIVGFIGGGIVLFDRYYKARPIASLSTMDDEGGVAMQEPWRRVPIRSCATKLNPAC